MIRHGSSNGFVLPPGLGGPQDPTVPPPNGGARAPTASKCPQTSCRRCAIITGLRTMMAAASGCSATARPTPPHGTCTGFAPSEEQGGKMTKPKNTLTIRGLDDRIIERLKARARTKGRSLEADLRDL